MKTTLLTLITSSLVLFTSCDSNTPLATGVDGAKLATSLTVPANGDRLIFSHSDSKPEALIGEVTLTGLITNSASISYAYKRLTNQRFELSVVPLRVDLSTPLANILGAPVSLSSRFRELIFRDDTDFTASENLEIIGFLNPSGGSLLIDPEDPLRIIASLERTYNFEIRSNVEDQILGSMGGAYFASESSFTIGYREPTALELNTYRFLTLKHKIPFITRQSTGLQITERGTFVFDLVNANNQPRN